MHISHKNNLANLLASLLSPSNKAWVSKLTFDPLHIEEESLLVEGEGRETTNSLLLCLCMFGG